MATPSSDMEKLQLSEDTGDDGDWDGKDVGGSRDHQIFQDRGEREAALRAELQTVRDINEVISGVLRSLERAKGNMEVGKLQHFDRLRLLMARQTVSQTVGSSSILLDTWTRILSQTEHNQRLILNPSWQGATKDIADIENEALLKQQEAERRALEEQQRKEALAKKQEEEERKRAQASSAIRGTRGATRTTTRSRISYAARGSAYGASRSSVRAPTTASTTSSIRRPAPTSVRPSGIARGSGRARGS